MAGIWHFRQGYEYEVLWGRGGAESEEEWIACLVSMTAETAAGRNLHVVEDGQGSSRMEATAVLLGKLERAFWKAYGSGSVEGSGAHGGRDTAVAEAQSLSDVRAE
jgi:hypothetical protein